ncbi:MAG TPA: outer membrane beta-barrel protein [Myxococcaceae bacterium]|nr:outer membrane beta-barrel protein [Myxococcaceae bacterium]
MRWVAGPLLALGVLSAGVQASEPPDFDRPGFEVGPQGGAYHHTPTGYASSYPAWGFFVGGELRWRLGEHLGIGGTITYASASTNASFAALGYSETLVTFEISWRFVPHPSLRPWLGVGFGLGSLGYSESGGDNPNTGSSFEFQPVRVRAGVDFTLGRVALGPWLGWGLEISDSSLAQPAMSLQIGVRVLLNLG